jgi:hypothetical protein
MYYQTLKIRKIIGFLISFCLLFTLTPVSGFAQESPVNETPIMQEEASGISENPPAAIQNDESAIPGDMSAQQKEGDENIPVLQEEVPVKTSITQKEKMPVADEINLNKEVRELGLKRNWTAQEEINLGYKPDEVLVKFKKGAIDLRTKEGGEPLIEYMSII